MQYDSTNRGALFKNDRKTKDSQPGYTGSLNIEGVEYFMDAWVKDGKSGKFFSVSVKRKDKQPGGAPQQQQSPQQGRQAPPQASYDDMNEPPF